MPVDESAVPQLWDSPRPGDDARARLPGAHLTEAARLAVALQEANRQLREANAKYQAMWDQGLFAGLLTTDGTVVDVNRSCLEASGFTRDDAIGKRFWDTPWWNRSAAVQAWIKAGFAEALLGSPFRGESVYFVADGSERIVDFAFMPIKDESGRVVYVIPTGMDVTDRRRADAQRVEAVSARHAEESEQQRRVYETALANTADFNYVFDLGGRFTFVNARLLALWGKSAADAVGRNFFELGYPLGLATRLQRQIQQVIDTKQALRDETPYASAIGARQYEYIFVPVLAADGTVEAVAGSTRDITDRKAIEEALRQSEERFRQSEARFRIFAESGPQMIWSADAEGNSIYTNPRWCEYTGLKPEQMSGRGSSRPVVHPDDYDHMMARWDAAHSAGTTFEAEFRLRRAADGVYRWFLSRGVPVRDAAGRIIQWVGANADIDDQKRAEEQLKEDDRRKTAFLALLAHELRNPLAPIRNGLQILKQDADRVTVARAVEMMDRQLGQLVRLVDDLLDVSRITQNKIELRKERVTLAAAIGRAVEISRPLIEAHNHDLRVVLGADPVVLEADLVRIAQVVSNLLNNSARYTPRGGRIELETESDGREVAIRVRDNGIGIPADALGSIFDMFTQGDRQQERMHGGLGLGLSLVKSLVELHGGSVSAASAGQGQGSEFTVRLPIVPDGLRPPVERVAPAAEPAAARRCILVVDDNRDSSESLAMLLEIMGHEVHVAYDGPNALEAARLHRPDTVLLDIGLPGMSGHTVARRMRDDLQMTSALLVAMTGWGQDADRRRSREAGFDHHLVKPVEPHALETLLASLTPH